MDEQEMVRIKRRVQAELLRIPGVHAVGIGPKEVGGRPTGEACIKVFVVRKRSLAEIPAEERIPSEIDGVKTDVYETPIPRTLQLPSARPPFPGDDARYRPLRGGIQIGRAGHGPGTLGCFFSLKEDPKVILGVTNHHVLYGTCATVAGNEAVGQPEEEDSCTGCCSSIIGTVFRAACNIDVDIALIKLRSGLEYLREVHEIGIITGVETITEAQWKSGTFQVVKRGPTTHKTGGVVNGLHMYGKAMMPDDKTLYRNYDHAIAIKPNPDASGPNTFFTRSGDSGAALLDESGRLLGILFGGPPPTKPGGDSFAMPIELIFAHFDSLPGNEKLLIQVETATALNQVRVVPFAAIDPARRPATTPASEPTTEPAFVPELEAALARTETGRWFTNAYLRHAREVRTLIQTNRRVATVWHRSGGAELFQTMVQVFRRKEPRVPERIQGKPIAECVQQVAAALARFGSAALRRDLLAMRPLPPAVGGLSYPEILEALERLDATSTLTAPQRNPLRRLELP